MNTYKRYSKEDEEYLISIMPKLYNKELTIRSVAKKLCREIKSVRLKLYKLGFKGVGHVRTLNEYAVYKGEKVLAIGTMQEIADELGISKSSVAFYGSPSNINATSEYTARRLIKLD